MVPNSPGNKKKKIVYQEDLLTPLSVGEKSSGARETAKSINKLQNETQQSLPDSAQFNTYKNVLENTIHDIPAA